jgi:nucleoside-diphosphate-sugar epimerase
MKIIDRAGFCIAFVINNENKFVGVVADSDIRRAILNGVNIKDSVKKIMNKNPVIVKERWNESKIKKLLQRSDVRARMPKHGMLGIPVLDENNHIIDIVFASEDKLEGGGKEYIRLTKDSKIVKPVNNILVVGGAGYLGSVLCRKLLDKGYFVRVLDNLTYGDVGIKELQGKKNFEFVKGDMRDIQTVVDSVKEVDTVIHLAAIVGDPASALDPEETIEINYLGTKLLAEVCKYSQINRFVFASTCSVYGASENPNTRINEHSKLNPVSIYAEMKLKSEEGILELADENFSPTILRMATLHGLSPRMRFDLVVNVLTIKALQEKKYSIFGGQQWRPNLYIQDAAEAFIKTLETNIENVGKKIFNVGSNKENYKIIEIGQMIKEYIPDAQMEIDSKNIDERNYNVSFDKINAELNYEPKYTVKDSILEIKNAVEHGEISDYTDEKYSNYRFLSKNYLK